MGAVQGVEGPLRKTGGDGDACGEAQKINMEEQGRKWGRSWLFK